MLVHVLIYSVRFPAPSRSVPWSRSCVHAYVSGFANFADELKKHEGNAAFATLSKQLKAIMKASTTPVAPSDDEEEEEAE